ncbi:ABC transporter substrate-binding protein [[Clostridium] polysaccharolyticum]|uniref:NitT/TauT family transport system substrate-binding protein n=1 Tax=[Clostridium] polysaccharolyticum TaxID=29364 RepID=A0A1I0BWM1_9FIRM|nr:ABC transporter substrate-binding protein [[Clostridium] polysaccharolyticum]SET11241.1 NitT/TauT family transport system substrate-binding protein [[Clostridium] polysaccharolyticum]
MKKRKQKIMALLLAMVLVFNLSGCAKNKGTSGNASADRDSGSKSVLRIANLPASFKACLTLIADAKGYLTEEGLNYELISLQNSSDALIALEENKIDVNPSGISNILAGIQDGEDLYVIGGSAQAGGVIIAKPKNAEKYSDLANWAKSTFASGRSYTGDFVVRHYLGTIGIDSNKDMKSVDLGDDLSIIQAVQKGQADVGYITANSTLKAVNCGLTLVTNVNDYEDAYPCCRISTNGKAIKEKYNELVLFLKGIIRAYDFILENKDETIKIMMDLTDQDKDYVTEVMYGDYASKYIPDPARQKVLNFAEYLKEADAIGNTDLIEDAINVEIYKKALDAIVEEYPDNENYQTLLSSYETFDLKK